MRGLSANALSVSLEFPALVVVALIVLSAHRALVLPLHPLEEVVIVAVDTTLILAVCLLDTVAAMATAMTTQVHG